MHKTISVLRRKAIKGLKIITKTSSENIKRKTIVNKILRRVYLEELEGILNSHRNVKGVIIYAPTVDWNIPLFQRPQHLASQLAKQGYLYFFCTPNSQYDKVHGFKQIENRCYITNQFDLLADKIDNFIIDCYSTTSNLDILSLDKLKLKLGKIKILYQYVDKIDESIHHSIDIAHKRHIYMIENADIFVVTSQKLFDEVASLRKENLYYVPNGVDYQHFKISKNIKQMPSDINHIVEKDKPIIGYYGALASWIDYDLLHYIAEHRPDIELVLIGVDYDGSMKKLERKVNISFLGRKHYTILPRYAVWFDVAIIPFMEGEIAKSTSPIKLFEYFALGKPVIVTKDMVECKKYKPVLVAKDKKNFLRLIDKALSLKDDKSYLILLDKIAKENTWEVRAKEIDSFVQRKYRI